MAKKDENKMTEEKPIEAKPIELPVIKIQKVPQKIKGLTDLTTGADDAEVVNNYTKYTAPSYEAKYGTREQFHHALLNLAGALVQPIEEQVEAFLYRATQNSYQAGKFEAFKGGNYMTPELKAQLVTVMAAQLPSLAGEKTATIFATWKAGFTRAANFEGNTYPPERIEKRKAFADRMLALAQSLMPSETDVEY